MVMTVVRALRCLVGVALLISHFLHPSYGLAFYSAAHSQVAHGTGWHKQYAKSKNLSSSRPQ
jgi:hypothetical protein